MRRSLPWVGPLLAVLICGFAGRASTATTEERNLIANASFAGPLVDGLPPGWVAQSPRPALAPEIDTVDERGQRHLHMAGRGCSDCVGSVSTQVNLTLGKTYWFRVRFRKSPDVSPLQHLLFEVAVGGDARQIVEFHRQADGWAEGEARLAFPGQGSAGARLRLGYRLCAKGEVWIERVELVEAEPVPPRLVRVGCTGGPDTLEKYGLPVFRQALDEMGRGKVDLALLPEYFPGEEVRETLTGPAATLMAEKAAEYRMYVAGTIGLQDTAADRVYNAALLFDRQGKLIGRYDKVHMYGPELEAGVTPGAEVRVFLTDFGRVGFMTCYDSWFTDVAELVALRGGDILLFPSLGYDRGLMHARALDNRINIVASSRGGGCGVWDTEGREISSAAASEGRSVNEVVTRRVDGLDILMVTLDLNVPLVGGSRAPVMRTKRYLANQRVRLDGQIDCEKERWWVE